MNPTNRFHQDMNTVHEMDQAALPEQLATVDLNLLVAFDALVRERHVTRAAERVGLTQSAMSHALGRLRTLLGDPLLVRGRGGMTLTPRAESLIVPLRSGLVILGRALSEPAEFHPESARRAFAIAAPDLFHVLAIPPLLERVRSQAPGVDIAVSDLSERRLPEQLETGEIDVAIVPQMDVPSAPPAGPSAPGLVRRTLFRDRFVCLMRADHPAFGQRRSARAAAKKTRLTLETYLALSHVLVSPTGEGPGVVDQVLARRGLRRRIALRLPHFYSALSIVAQSDLIVTAPSAMARLLRPELPVVAVPPPLSLPQHSIHLVWHERFSKDLGHGWLRDQVREVARPFLPSAEGHAGPTE